MSNLIYPIVVGLGVAVSAFPIVAVAGPPPAPSAARSAQDDGTPADLAPAEGSVEAPPSSPASPSGDAPAPSMTVLLMKDLTIRVLDGAVVENRDEYVLTKSIGEVRVPRSLVEGRFGTMREVYEYQRDHLPDRDPDEHLRLARWCLSHHMQVEAAEQLRALLSWSPGDRTAETMLRSIDASIANRATSDPGVVRTGGDLARGLGTEPRELDVSVLGQIRAYKGPVAFPAIFDLPEPLAVRRFREFGDSVHRVVQARCASCHDETSDRNFRLVRARDPKDMANVLLAITNLDATLALVDRTNPGHSPLLINAVMPHGPDQKPILPHPNSPEYRALWNWIASLSDSGTGTGTTSAAADPMVAPAPSPFPGTTPQAAGSAPTVPGDPDFGGGFATERTGPIAPASAPAPVPTGSTMVPYPHMSTRQGQMERVHPSVPAGLDFQTVSPLLGSPEAAPLTIDGRTVLPPGSAMTPAQALARPNGGPAAPGTVPRPALPAPGTAPPPPGARGLMPGGVAPPPGQPPRPGSNAPAAAPAAAQPGVVSFPDGTQIISQPDGSKMMRLPDGELIPYMDKAAVDRQTKAKDGAKEIQIDPALLEQIQIDPALREQFQRRRLGGP